MFDSNLTHSTPVCIIHKFTNINSAVKRLGKNSPVKGWGGLSKSQKMSNCPSTQQPTRGGGWLRKSKIFKENWNILIRLWFIWFLKIWHVSSQTTHQTIHPPMGAGVSIEFKSSNQIELSQLIQDLLNGYWFGSIPMGWVAGWVELGGGVSTNHISSHRIELSRLDHNLLHFY